MNANIAARLIDRASLHPERVAIVEVRRGRCRSITFGELSRRVAHTAAGLRREGVSAGARVLLFVPMSIDLYVALLATLHLGAAAIFVDAWGNRARLEAAVDLASPRLLIAPPLAHFLRLTSSALRRIPRHWVSGRSFLRLARHEVHEASAPAAVDGAAPALITFTTGSTGRPKAAVRSHALLWAQHLAFAGHLQLHPDDVDMPTLPVFVLNNLALGVTSVLPDFDPRAPARIDAGRIVAQMRQHGVTTSSGSPAFYERVAEWCSARGQRLDLRLWTGGAPVYPPLARELDAITAGGAHVVYGSTEAEPIAGINAGAMLKTMEGSEAAEGLCCGFPIPEIQLRIIRVLDEAVILGIAGWAEWEVEAGAVGEIVVTGAHVVGEYLHAPDESRRHKIRDGSRIWHRTGDAGRFDAEGRLWLMGRTSSRVVRAGVTWWSAPAEVRALELPGIAHAAYVGVRDGELGQRAVLCVEGELKDGAEPLLRQRLAPIPIDEVRVLERIPRDPRHASKTDLQKLKEILQPAR